MAFRLGLVGLCTSHPSRWVPIIRELSKEGKTDIEVIAAWDSGETRPKDFAVSFCREFNIPQPIANLEDMVDQVDGVIIHSANWDKHIEQARPFVEANKSVFIDKPIIGNLKDANELLDWAKMGKRITGGSSLRFAYEIRDYLAKNESERGRLLNAYVGCGTDEFNYGIHAYSLLSNLMGPGINSAQCLSRNGQIVARIDWKDGKIGVLNIVPGGGLPFHITAITTAATGFLQIQIDAGKIYRAMLEAVLPYLSGKEENPPLSMNELLEPELAAIAVRTSWQNDGRRLCLSDLSARDRGYDGGQFEIEYRRARL